MREGTLVADRFVLGRLAGSGGMGDVYRAVDRETGDDVALKIMHTRDGNAQRFLREGRVLADLRAPGIVRYVAHGLTTGGTPYLAMEWLDGEELAQRLARSGLSVRESVLVVRSAAEALAPAHARGVIHRDLKPSNIFLVGGELTRLKILDFGLARLAAAPRGVTMSGILMGTPAYMAPEQARGEKDLDPRTDVFGLGCVLFECLTGRTPFVGEHVVAILTKILMEDAPELHELRTGIPVALEELVRRMLAKDRGQRPRDAQRVVEHLDALGALQSGELGPPSTAHRALTGSERKLVSVVLAEMPDSPDSSAATIAQDVASADVERLRASLEPFGAQVERLADGSFVATLAVAGSATDQAAQAARCALAMKEQLPEASVAVSTGQAELAARLPVGDAAERAAAILRTGAQAAITLDDNTAALLDARFEVTNRRVLVGTREHAVRARTLLGRATPFVGRDRELATLFAIWDEVVSEPVARAVVVTAGPGVGKSRLRTELVARLVARGPSHEVWLAQGDPMSTGAPFGMIARALRSTVGLVEGEPHHAKREKIRARVSLRVDASDVDRVSEFVGELVGVPFPDDTSVQLRAARQDRQLMGDQMRRAFEDFVAAETKRRPILLVLEDLHWGDLSSVKLIDSALRNLSDRPWMVIALGRPVIHELFGLPWAERGSQEIRLGDFSRKASERLIREVLGAEVDAQTLERICAAAAGNAFFLEELIRAVAEGRGEKLPDTVLAMVQSRLESLPAEARRVLRAASIFGQRFPVSALGTLLGEIPAATIDEWLRHLVELEHLSKVTRGEAEELAFRHALVHEAAYSTLTDSDRRLGHRLVAEWLERAGDADPSAVAEHYESGGRPERSAPLYLRACEQALEGNDLSGAIARADRGLACGAQGELRGRLLLNKSEALVWQGNFEAAADEAARAVGHLTRREPSWYAAVGTLALSRSTAGDTEGFLTIAADLNDAAPTTDAAFGPYVIAMAHIATRLLYLSKFVMLEEALQSIEQAIKGRDWAAATYGGWIEDARSTRAMATGDMAGCLRHMEGAARLLDATGDRRNACRERGHIGYAYMELGCYEEAERTLVDTLAAAQRLGLEHVAAGAMHNLGMVLARLGRHDEGVRMERRAITALTAQHDARLAVAARCYLAEMYLLQSRPIEAEREVRMALDGVLDGDARRAPIVATLARALTALGRHEEALPHARDGMNLLDRFGALEEGEMKVRLGFVETLRGAGERAGAREAAVAAKRRILELADKITEPAWRERFLCSVFEHARLIALADALIASDP